MEVPKGEGRVIRGGSWNNNAQNCRSANRKRNNPRNRNNNNGFRLCSSSHGQTAAFTDVFAVQR
ncbi:MAG: SUMF1/EgtB/PvdO family nonheme iron enzyme [Candidatus Coatesbacteria bacterium]|nr:SUMF1/EgtB/PvdO family nonheme iron enzyme [Candidatus Coatesbacteria bacterium]